MVVQLGFVAPGARNKIEPFFYTFLPKKVHPLKTGQRKVTAKQNNAPPPKKKNTNKQRNTKGFTRYTFQRTKTFSFSVSVLSFSNSGITDMSSPIIMSVRHIVNNKMGITND